jgi:hypothetical protein
MTIVLPLLNGAKVVGIRLLSDVVIEGFYLRQYSHYLE